MAPSLPVRDRLLWNAVLEVKRLDVLVSGMMDALVLLFWESAREHQNVPWMQRQVRKVIGGLREIERRLGGRAYAVGDAFGYADMSIVAVLGMMDTVDSVGLGAKFQSVDPTYSAWRSMYPALAACHDHLHERPSVREASPRHVRTAPTDRLGGIASSFARNRAFRRRRCWTVNAAKRVVGRRSGLCREGTRHDLIHANGGTGVDGVPACLVSAATACGHPVRHGRQYDAGAVRGQLASGAFADPARRASIPGPASRS